MSIPTPSFASSHGRRVNVVQSPVGPGPWFRRAQHVPALSGDPIEVFKLTYLPGQLDNTTAQELIDDFNAAKGRAGKTSFTPSWTGTAVDVRYVNDELTLDHASIIAHGCEIELERAPF